MTFDEIMKAIRIQLDITQEQLAHELNISFSTISRWENGHTFPSRLAKKSLLDFSKNNNVDSSIIHSIEGL